MRTHGVTKCPKGRWAPPAIGRKALASSTDAEENRNVQIPLLAAVKIGCKLSEKRSEADAPEEGNGNDLETTSPKLRLCF